MIEKIIAISALILSAISIISTQYGARERDRSNRAYKDLGDKFERLEKKIDSVSVSVNELKIESGIQQEINLNSKIRTGEHTTHLEEVKKKLHELEIGYKSCINCNPQKKVS